MRFTNVPAMKNAVHLKKALALELEFFKDKLVSVAFDNEGKLEVIAAEDSCSKIIVILSKKGTKWEMNLLLSITPENVKTKAD